MVCSVSMQRSLVLMVAGFGTAVFLYLKVMNKTTSFSTSTGEKPIAKGKSNTSSWLGSPIRHRSPSLNGSDIGLPFSVSESYLSGIGFPITDYITITRSNVGDFVFATGANEGFFHVDMDSIATVQRLFPNHTIYFYDLSDGKLSVHVDKIKQLCNVIYRRFNFSVYPPHIRNLHFYAWKPLAIHEVLRENRGVFWFDSSVKFHTGNISVTVGPAVATDGVLTFTTGGGSVFAQTHEGMFKYLRIPKALTVNSTAREAGDSLFYRTKFTYKNIVSWWVLCALEKNCIASTSNLGCNFRGRDVWAGCNRFDQSALNILLANAFPYEPENNPIYVNSGAGISVERGRHNKEKMVVCQGKKLLANALDSHAYFA